MDEQRGRGVGEVAEGIIIYGGEGTLVEWREGFDRHEGGGTRPRGGTDGGTRRSEGTQSDVVVEYGRWRPYGSRGRKWRESRWNRSGPGGGGEGTPGAEWCQIGGVRWTCGVWRGMGSEWGRKRLRNFRVGESAGVEEAVVHGAWPGLRGGVGGGGTGRGMIHSMKSSCRGSSVGGTCAWRRGRRREGRSFGERGCGGEEAGCRREVVPNLHVGATSVCGSGVACCMVGRGACGRIAVHEFA